MCRCVSTRCPSPCPDGEQYVVTSSRLDFHLCNSCDNCKAYHSTQASINRRQHALLADFIDLGIPNHLGRRSLARCSAEQGKALQVLTLKRSGRKTSQVRPLSRKRTRIVRQSVMTKTSSKRRRYCSSRQSCTALHGKQAARDMLNKLTWEQQEMEMRAETLLKLTTEITSELPACVSNSWLVRGLLAVLSSSSADPALSHQIHFSTSP